MFFLNELFGYTIVDEKKDTLLIRKHFLTCSQHVKFTFINSREFHEAFYADAVRRVNLLTLAFALYFPAFERLRSTRSLA